MAQSKLQPARGTQDFLPDDMQKLRAVFDSAAAVSRRYGFEEMATPIFEATELFARGVGEATDVVSKEMYSFVAREGGDSLTLRPENTAGVARAFMSNGLQQSVPFKCYYAGPMFRYERPQKGRYRQFHQIGVECLGAPQPLADVEVIACGQRVLEAFGIAERCTLMLNTLGDSASRAAYRDALVAYFSDHKDALTAESVDRLTRNPLRILDSKSESDQVIVAGAPIFSNYLNQESQDFFAAVRQGLDELGIAYTLDPKLVRGLDYYGHTAFEFVTSDLGAQSGVLGGGRYDGLIEKIGGPSTAGVGWAAGAERIMLLMNYTPPAETIIAVVPVGETEQAQALRLCEQLREAGYRVDQAFSGNMGKRMKRANKVGARLAVICGEALELKDLSTGTQIEITEAILVGQVKEILS